jgi:ParB family chromosome partitioning protein
LEVKVREIRPNPHQPRQSFDEPEIESLAESIRASGLLQPLLVRRERTGGYTLIAGERRLRAARHAGLERVPVVLRDIADERLLEYALVENLQRDDLRPVETARAFRLLVRRFGLTQAEVASRLGKPRSTVANFLRLLDLPQEVQDLLESGRLSMGHGRALAALEDGATQVRLARVAAKDGWSVRQVEEQVRRRQAAEAPRKRDQVRHKDPNVAAAEQTLSRSLGARVAINQLQSGRGRIEIGFASSDDLDRLYRALIRVGGAESA